MNRLKDKVVIVTGGAQGIGAALTRRFHAEGAHVVIADVNHAAGADLAQSIDAQFVETDISNHDAVSQLIDATMRHHGRLDTVVSNAAVFHSGAIDQMPPNLWEQVLAVNLTAAYHLAHFAAPHLRRQQGASIVLISSVQALVGFRGFAAYAASKGGLLALTRQLAVDLAPQVRVNAISPGTIRSRRDTPLDPKIEREWATRHLLRRIGEPNEIANAALFLASDEASFITGHNLIVDGGLTARGE